MYLIVMSALETTARAQSNLDLEKLSEFQRRSKNEIKECQWRVRQESKNSKLRKVGSEPSLRKL